MLGDGVVFNPGEHADGVLVVTALPSDVDHFRRVTGAISTSRSASDTIDARRTCRCRGRARGSCSPR